MKKHSSFETKKINMETLPEYLIAARESFSYDQKHVAKITNISEKFLAALEQGAYYKLPADVYVFGFLRKLAELYRCEPALLIEQYKKERGIQENLNKTAKRNAYKPSVPSRFSITPRTIAFAVLGVFVFFILGYLVYQVHAINKPPVIVVYEPADGAVVHTSSVLIRGKTEPGAVLTLNNDKVDVDSSGGFKKVVSVNPGHTVLTFAAKNNFGKQSSQQVSIIADYGQTQQTNIQAQPFTATITIGPGSVHLSVAVDDQQPEAGDYTVGTIKTYTVRNQISISTDDGGSTSLRLNDKDYGKLGREGENLKNIVFTQQNIQ